MKKIISANMALLLLLLCGCSDLKESKDTRFLLDTIVTLTANCDDETLDGAFDLCAQFEKLFSRTVADSDVSKLNTESGFIPVSKDTVTLVERALYYSELSGGAFDITIYPVSVLWDFKNQVIPNRDEIAEALQNVDYHSVSVKGNTINLNGKKVDLGGIAKGYIADRMRDYFKEKKVSKGIINLGGNVIIFGSRASVIGIRKPFTSDEVSAELKLKNKSVVTSGIYERFIKKGDTLYHHILDSKTGYGVQSDLASATIISNKSVDGDALSTVCVLLGYEKASALIESIADTEAVFIETNGTLSYTSGIEKRGKYLQLKTDS